MSIKGNETVDYGQIYDEVEKSLKSTSQFSIIQDSLPVPSMDLYALALMEKNHLILYNAFYQIQQKLTLLEGKLFISELSIKLQALEIWKKRYEDALNTSSSFKQLNKQIILEARNIKQLIHILDQIEQLDQIPELEVQIEHLNEKTASFSEQITDFDELGYDVRILKKSKLIFNQLMNKLQEKLDEVVIKLWARKSEHLR